MFVCVAGKNDISVNVLQTLFEKKDKNYELGIICNQNETGKDSWQKSLRFYARKCGIREYTLQEIYQMKELVFFSMEFDQILKPERFIEECIHRRYRFCMERSRAELLYIESTGALIRGIL